AVRPCLAYASDADPVPPTPMRACDGAPRLEHPCDTLESRPQQDHASPARPGLVLPRAALPCAGARSCACHACREPPCADLPGLPGSATPAGRGPSRRRLPWATLALPTRRLACLRYRVSPCLGPCRATRGLACPGMTGRARPGHPETRRASPAVQS